MKDKIIEIQDGDKYYILESVTYGGKLYALGALCDPEEDTMNDEELYLMEIYTNDEETFAFEVLDETIAEEVITEFQKKMQSNS